MAAVLELKRAIGANLATKRNALYTELGQTFVEISTLDSAQHSSGDYPITKPQDSSTSYSMEVWLYLEVTKAPDNNINNVKFWFTDTAVASGIYLFLGTAISGTGITPTNENGNRATSNAMAYYGPAESFQWDEGGMSEVGSCSAYLCLQYQYNSAAGTGDEYGSNSLGHYSYDES